MRRSLKVLIVDDDMVHLLVVSAWLENAGCEVISRSSPFGTGGVILKSQPDVVLLDVEMPGLSGEGLADLITKRMNKTSIGVIFYSGKRAETLSALAEQYCALGFIEKTDSSALFLDQFFELTAELRNRRA